MMSDKLLVVDDSARVRSEIRETLGDVFTEVVEADDGISAIRAFVEEKPSFIITDIEMPNINGFRLISAVRNMEEGASIPIIMLSGTSASLRDRLSGFDAGASDFLIKPFENEELTARVRSLLRVQRLVAELKQKNALLEKLATTDELTGLYNRRYFFDAVNSQMALGCRHGFKLACMLIDVDHFKRINDTLGHAVGDEVLRKIGRLLDSCKREGELLARFGGEEFVICLFNTSTENALLGAERFRKLIGSTDFSSDGHTIEKLTISIGLAIYPQDFDLDVDELLKAADDALYESKSRGRDTVSVFEWESASQGRKAPGPPA